LVVESRTGRSKWTSYLQLPGPRLSPVYRLEAALGEPLDLGDTAPGRRRVVALTDGTFTGPELNGRLLPGASADWQMGWLNKGVFISFGGRQPAGVIYETYHVD
jgi:hypothetical protein